MSADQERGAGTLWVGMNCRNPLCRKDFVAHLDGAPITSEQPEGNKICNGISVLSTALSALISVAAGLQGTHTPELSDGAVNATRLLQECPHCGRRYFYLLNDYFITDEPVPQCEETDHERNQT